jgi:hypothetical protein
MKAAQHERCGAAGNAKLFGFLLLFHLFYLLALVLNLLLLLLQLALRLLSLYVLVLHFVADYISAGSAQSAANCGSGTRMAHRGADYRSGAGTQQSADARAFFALAQRLSRAACNEQGCRERQRRRS